MLLRVRYPLKRGFAAAAMAHDRLSRRNTQEQSSISVVVRVRPLLAHEIKRRSREIAEVAADERSVRLNIADRKNSSDLKDYSFSFVASPATSQEEFFSQCGVPRLLDYALDGYASTIFAYGQTGSGKTFSISGSEASAGESAVGAAQSGGSVDKSHGIIPRAIECVCAFLCFSIIFFEPADPRIRNGRSL